MYLFDSTLMRKVADMSYNSQSLQQELAPKQQQIMMRSPHNDPLGSVRVVGIELLALKSAVSPLLAEPLKAALVAFSILPDSHFDLVPDAVR